MRITILDKHQVFVFGSNEAGRHGKGAAKDAMLMGAKYGKGVGHYGQTYAIPTKDKNLKTLPLSIIAIYINGFIEYAKKHTELEFLVTRIGCGLAGYNINDMRPLFANARGVDNIILPDEFK